MLGDFASLDVQNTYRGSDAYVHTDKLSTECCTSDDGGRLFFYEELLVV
ncbi:hypothetical protein [Piscirickettsia salmonis]|nr:hypothetical protein [Piscirickettsia salmonis]QHS25888.1 hypothetical protein GW538_07975 [Piscirickettsia salmonis]QHS29129.1 hypothetical protein GW537_08420 [Piscirickettsia salmonis]